MSEYFTGVTFPQQKVTPSDDAAVRRAIVADSILSGCALTYAGSTLTMGAGSLIACGRQFRHTSVQNWPVTGAASGYARLVLTIDTSRASTKGNFDQITASIEYASAVEGFLSLQQEDINESGVIYQVPICIVSLGAGGITGFVAKLGKNAVTAVLPVSGWIDNKQTIYVLGVSADFPISVSPDSFNPENREAYISSDVVAVSKAAGKITFRCESVPSLDLTVNIALRA